MHTKYLRSRIFILIEKRSSLSTEDINLLLIVKFVFYERKRGWLLRTIAIESQFSRSFIFF